MEHLVSQKGYKDVVLLVIGDGKDIEELRREAQERLLEGN